LNLDGDEYTMAPSQIIVEGWAGRMIARPTEPPRGVVDSGTLAMCSLDIDFVLSLQPEFVINLDVWNQNEVLQSRHLRFYQFEAYDLFDDLQLGMANIFTPKWQLGTVCIRPLWAVYVQYQGEFGMAQNAWQDPGSGVPCAVVLPPVPQPFK
jgi:hypothetical protein